MEPGYHSFMNRELDWSGIERGGYLRNVTLAPFFGRSLRLCFSGVAPEHIPVGIERLARLLAQ
jgi:hypothetical protein